MKRAIALSLLTTLMCVSVLSADLLLPRPAVMDQNIEGGTLRIYADTFVGEKRALTVLSGNGRSCLGVYVYDGDGNCVAWDDITSAQTSDDIAVDWIPAETGRYEVRVRNAGYAQNIFRIALR